MRKLFAIFHYGFTALFLLGLLASCGGGGGGGGSSPPIATTYALSGAVSGAVQQGVTITLSGTAAGTTVTDAAGAYRFTGLSNGDYTVTATLAGYTFTPASQMVTILNTNAVATSIVSEYAYGISGAVEDGSSAPVAGATITLTGAGLASALTATTDASGNYSFNALAPGDYTVTPAKDSEYNAGSHLLTTYSFTPPNQPVTISTASSTGVDFVMTATTTTAYSITGKIITGTKDSKVSSDPFILEGVSVMLSDPSYTTTVTTTTDADGNYAFHVPDGDYIVWPPHFDTGNCPFPTLYSFSPASQAITVSGADLAVATDFSENLSQDGCAHIF